MKSYLDTLERLGYAMPNELGVSLILNSLNKDYDQFVQNYNMHSMGKSIVELHAMLKLYEKGIPKKAETPAEDGLLEEELSVLHVELKERKNTRIAQGLRRSRKLKHRALSLYVGNGMRIAVEAIGSYDLVLPSGLLIPMVQEASGSHGLLKSSGSDEGLELIQEEDTQPSENTSEVHNEVAPIEVEPQNVEVLIRRSARIPQAPDRYDFYVDVEEYELGDLNEPHMMW
ncbi:hypothetical protein Tco_1111370 [Tanacetum coccineum]|uniref:Zinc finger, CCHC-type n=1 Tax=Tanacetum coccineum TaxID=301880 RepID=A0ABQ5ILH7_9ASTR